MAGLHGFRAMSMLQPAPSDERNEQETTRGSATASRGPDLVARTGVKRASTRPISATCRALS